MPTPITGVPGASHTSPITFNAPADTDAATAASVIVPFQALADVVSHHQADSASQAGNNTFAGTNTFNGATNVAVPTAAAHPLRKDSALARSNLPAVGQAVSASCGLWSTNAVGETAITNLSVSLTTTGRPVMVILQPSGGPGAIQFDSASGEVDVRLYRDSTLIATFQTKAFGTGSTYAHGGALAVDLAAAGTYAYSAKLYKSGSFWAYVSYLQLVAFEL